MGCNWGTEVSKYSFFKREKDYLICCCEKVMTKNNHCPTTTLPSIVATSLQVLQENVRSGISRRTCHLLKVYYGHQEIGMWLIMCSYRINSISFIQELLEMPILSPHHRPIGSETVGMEPCVICVLTSPSQDSDVPEVVFNLLHVMSFLSQISTRGQLLFLNSNYFN